LSFIHDLSFIHGFIADSDCHLERFSVLLVLVLFDGRHDVVGVPVGGFERERSLGFDAVLVVQDANGARKPDDGFALAPNLDCGRTGRLGIGGLLVEVEAKNPPRRKFPPAKSLR